MSNSSFKVKNGLTLTPKDLTTLVNPEAGDVACDINDNNKIKRYDSLSSTWVEVGSGGVGGVDILFVEDFESAGLNQFTQVGLSLSQVDPLKGRVSAVLNHQAGTSPANDQFFKQVKPVDRKFRGENMVLRFDVKSDASQGNLVVKVYDETNAADIVASEQLQLSNDVSGIKSSVAFVIPSNCESISYTVTALPESGKVSRIDDVVCELARNEVVQSGLVQEGDSTIQLSGANGFNGLVRLFSNIEKNIGSDIEYRPATGEFVARTAGIYSVSYSEISAANTTTSRISIAINGVQVQRAGDLVNTATTSQKIPSVSWTGYLNEGDVVTGLSQVTSELSGAAAFFTMSKQGSLKQAAVASDQKITIPTSELRFEGASSRGSVATAIVKFDTLAKIRGDAFTVVNTAADGTYIQMNKAGKLDINTSLIGGDGTLVITKNQTNLTAIPSNSDELLSSSSNATGRIKHSSWNGNIKEGDILRVLFNSTITDSSFNNLNLSFQEQEIQVSVSNTLPQFSESDSSIRLSGANGFGSSVTTTRRFASVEQNIGSDIEYVDSPTLGGQFIAKSAGIYHVSYSETTTSSSTNADLFIRVNENNVSLSGDRLNTASSINRRSNVSWSGFLSENDVITLGGGNLSGDEVLATISKVGKPNVTGVDVTPFVNIPQPESQSSEIYNTSTVVTGAGVYTGALTSSQGQGLYSYNSTTGVYTVLKRAKISLHLSARTNAAAAVTVYINDSSSSIAAATSPATSAYFISCSAEQVFSPGETFIFGIATGTATNYHSISVSATAESDQILTAPETFSTDTAALTYASSSQYNLTTLANAPVGTFITFTYAANTNTRTQTTTPPTQFASGSADANANGILLYTRAYNASSSAAQPAAFAIQIGKGMKGVTRNAYASINKSVAVDLRDVVVGTTTEYGAVYNEYEESTGVLIVDLGACSLTSITGHGLRRVDNLSSIASSYLVVSASKNPALTGLNSETVSARVLNTAGTSIASADTKIPFNSSASIVNNMTIDNANNRIYAPHSGIYWIDAGVQFASAAYTAGNQLQIKIYKNGVYYSTLAAKTVDAAVTQKQGLNGSDQIRLAKGDYIEFYASNARGATALSTTSGECYMNITKKGL